MRDFSINLHPPPPSPAFLLRASLLHNAKLPSPPPRANLLDRRFSARRLFALGGDPENIPATRDGMRGGSSESAVTARRDQKQSSVIGITVRQVALCILSRLIS